MSIPMIPPAIAIIFVLGIVFGSLFYLWKGRTWSDLLLFIFVAIFGFAIGQLIAAMLQLNVLKIGQMHWIEGALFAWLLMLAIAWLKG